MRDLSDAAVQLELEKAQRLVRTIEAEIRWRKSLQLEEVVRKEMIIEREMSMRRGNTLALPQETCFALLGLNAFNMPPTPRPTEINAADMKRESEGSKGKLIVLPKPSQTRYEGKRKAGAESKDEFEKKAKEAKVVREWRCELCSIWTTSEKGLNDHVKGKKHTAGEKARNRKMVSQKSANWSLPSVVSACSKMAAKPEMEGEEVEADKKR